MVFILPGQPPGERGNEGSRGGRNMKRERKMRQAVIVLLPSWWHQQGCNDWAVHTDDLSSPVTCTTNTARTNNKVSWNAAAFWCQHLALYTSSTPHANGILAVSPFNTFADFSKQNWRRSWELFQVFCNSRFIWVCMKVKNCFREAQMKAIKTLYSGDKLHRNILYCSDQLLWEQSLLQKLRVNTLYCGDTFCVNLWELSTLWRQTLCEFVGTFHIVETNFVWICGNIPHRGDKLCVNLWEHSTLWRQTLCEFVGKFHIVETNFVWICGNIPHCGDKLYVNLWESSTLWRQTLCEFVGTFYIVETNF